MSKNDAEREKRLAQALRANLKRRKFGGGSQSSAQPAERDRNSDRDSEERSDADAGPPHDATSDRH